MYEIKYGFCKLTPTMIVLCYVFPHITPYDMKVALIVLGLPIAKFNFCNFKISRLLYLHESKKNIELKEKVIPILFYQSAESNFKHRASYYIKDIYQ